MKKCPNCKRIFNDDELFCLEDGSSLVTEPNSSTQETLVLYRKKNKFPIIILGLFLLMLLSGFVGFMISRNITDWNQSGYAVNNQIPQQVQEPLPLSAPTAQNPKPTPTMLSDVDNSKNVNINAEVEIDSSDSDVIVPPNRDIPEKVMPVIMKIEDHSLVFGLQQCRKSGSSITCDFTITNKGADRNFQLAVYRSTLFDELGNSYNGKTGRVANQEGDPVRIGFISGVSAKAQLTFERIDPIALKITFLKIQFGVGDEYDLEVRFRNVPLTLSK